MKKLLAIIIISLVAFACSHKTSSTTQTTLKESSATVTHEQYVEGRSVYEVNCQRCHALKNPQNYTLDEWSKWVDKMAPKAKLTDEQKTLVLNYGSVNVKAN